MFLSFPFLRDSPRGRVEMPTAELRSWVPHPKAKSIAKDGMGGRAQVQGMEMGSLH